MVAGKKNQRSTLNTSVTSYPNWVTGSSAGRNLEKSHLGGVIFGCKNNTIKECLSKQLFGLPTQHFSYVKNIDPGLPLFLFNYSDRKLHGIFEAASAGQMNINPYGWTTDASERTKYPAQVQISIRMHYQPLLENQFKPIIIDNYHSHAHFWFELDRAQTNRLMSLFASLVDAPSSCLPHNSAKQRTIFEPLPWNDVGEEGEGLNPFALEIKHSNPVSEKLDSTNVASSFDVDSQILEAQLDAELAEQGEKKVRLSKLKGLALCHEHQDLPMLGYMKDVAFMNDIQLEDKGFQGKPTTGLEENKKDNPHSSFGVHEKNEENSRTSSGVQEKKEGNPHSSSESQSTIAQLIQEVQELKAFNAGQTQKFASLEQKLMVANTEIQHLKDRCVILEHSTNPSKAFVSETNIDGLDEVHLDLNESIFLIGGCDGESWLSAVHSYDPSQDAIKSLRAMNSVRSFSSAAQLKGDLYVFGGGNGNVWFDTVESYSPANDQWTICAPLNQEKGSLAGATIDNKIFAIGGGNGTESFSDVEMLDLEIGKWISTGAMLQRRFALAAVELNGVLYATGGFDGKNYLESAERFDPRQHSWSRIASMNTKRSSHSLVVFNEKLYALGGYDGSTMVSSIEIFDPRRGSWMCGEPMKNARGYSAAGVIKDSIYVIGGIKGCGNIIDTAETYKDGQGWQEFHTMAVGKRSFMSSIVYSPPSCQMCRSRRRKLSSF